MKNTFLNDKNAYDRAVAPLYKRSEVNIDSLQSEKNLTYISLFIQYLLYIAVLIVSTVIVYNVSNLTVNLPAKYILIALAGIYLVFVFLNYLIPSFYYYLFAVVLGVYIGNLGVRYESFSIIFQVYTVSAFILFLILIAYVLYALEIIDNTEPLKGTLILYPIYLVIMFGLITLLMMGTTMTLFELLRDFLYEIPYLFFGSIAVFLFTIFVITFTIQSFMINLDESIDNGIPDDSKYFQSFLILFMVVLVVVAIVTFGQQDKD